MITGILIALLIIFGLAYYWSCTGHTWKQKEFNKKNCDLKESFPGVMRMLGQGDEEEEDEEDEEDEVEEDEEEEGGEEGYSVQPFSL
tara:strand:- start:941 stop:1201 length:261 start_codon:yes stop_codon:yes gene_type:complete